jgi:catechol 2,3-dioxygenase-like lactoylglutathione lyase family enzyme
MMRLHVHIGVSDITASVRFYSSLFGADPTVVKPDYAKWMLDDPCVNFAISERPRDAGFHHLGIQAETEGELADIYRRLDATEAPVLDEGETSCCYARSEKSWVHDPQGVPWEAFLTHGKDTTYCDAGESAGSACCIPTLSRRASAAKACCAPA